MNLELDKKDFNSHINFRSLSELMKIMNDFDLVDIWSYELMFTLFSSLNNVTRCRFF